MKALLIAILLSILLVLNGCATPPATTPDEVTLPTAAATDPTTAPTTAPTAPTETPVTTDPTTESSESVAVYEKAVVDTRLDVEDYSWERNYEPEFLMIHFTSAVVNHPDDPYNIKYIQEIYVDYDISIHYIIQRDGTVYSLIPESRVAWHAGYGTYMDDPKYTDTINRYAIGIELLAIGSEEDMAFCLTPDEYRALDDSLKGYTEAQYAALAELVTDLCRRYDIPQDSTHIIGHDTYSPDKPDPGDLFDWSRILADVD